MHDCRLHREVDKNSSLLGYSLLMFQDNLSDLIGTNVWVLRQLIGHLKAPKRHHYSLHNNSEEHSSQNAHMSNSYYTVTSYMFHPLMWLSSETSYKG
jgi:hypothetical protein